MTYFLNVLRIEFLKIRKSKVILLTALAFSIAPIMAGFFMFILKNPTLAQQSGLVGAKAQIAGEANWPSFIQLHAQMVGVGGLIVFGFMMSWVFGREFTDKTIKDLLILPYSRSIIVFAKFLSVLITSLLLSLYIIVFGIIIGMVIGLPGWSVEVIQTNIALFVNVTLLSIFVSTPVAFFASYGRGYLAPLGYVIVTLVFAQIIAAIGYGTYFPWSIPALIGGLAGTPESLQWSQFFIIFFTSIIGVVGTLYWWRFADQHD